jgi:N-acetylmuramoyl-L-alanine amidase
MLMAHVSRVARAQTLSWPLAIVAIGALVLSACAPAVGGAHPAPGAIAEAAVIEPAPATAAREDSAPSLPDTPAAVDAPVAVAAAVTEPVDSGARPPLRIPKPAVPVGPRRIGLQAGHWRTNEAPPELRRLETQTGTSWGGYTEWELNLDVANRVAAILRGDGYVVDVLPTVLPPNYLADVFVALHADGDPSGGARGFKAAHGSRRGPYEDKLVSALVEEYGRVTGLPQDGGITRNMLGYYAFSWSRFQWAAAAHTPAAILEMGFMTHAADRALLLQRPDVVARGVANGILRFLEEVPAGAAFAEDLLVPQQAPRPPAGQPGGAPPNGQAPAAGAPGQRTVG